MMKMPAERVWNISAYILQLFIIEGCSKNDDYCSFNSDNLRKVIKDSTKKYCHNIWSLKRNLTF